MVRRPGQLPSDVVTVADRVKQDVVLAMKQGDKDRVQALRLILSELQKAAKEGDGDETAVLRRERKRRQESARAFRDGGRAELATAEETEAELIGAYLPAELSDEELDSIVAGVHGRVTAIDARPASRAPCGLAARSLAARVSFATSRPIVSVARRTVLVARFQRGWRAWRVQP